MSSGIQPPITVPVPRPSLPAKSISTHLPLDIIARIEKLAARVGIPRSKLMRVLIENSLPLYEFACTSELPKGGVL